MRDTILLFESRDLCYESNQYFKGPDTKPKSVICLLTWKKN